MPKSSKENIEKDKKIIISELEKNSNRSVNEIADKLGFSRQKVWRIIKNLEEDKTIWGYTAILDDDKVGRKRFCILLKKAPVKTTDDALNKVITRELRQVANKNGVTLESTYFFHGLYDGQICVTAENITQVKRFITDMEKKMGSEYFKKTDILEILVPIQMRGFNNPNLEKLKDYF
jgi:DNA-binding Lrp family transcriptional regulator